MFVGHNSVNMITSEFGQSHLKSDTVILLEAALSAHRDRTLRDIGAYAVHRGPQGTGSGQSIPQ